MTTIVTINTQECERRITERAYKNTLLLQPGFLRFGFENEELIPPCLRVSGMRVGIRVKNLLWNLQNAETNVDSMMEATGFFSSNGVNAKGREFADSVLPYFVYVVNTIEKTTVNNMEVWNGFLNVFIERISGGEHQWTTVG